MSASPQSNPAATTASGRSRSREWTPRRIRDLGPVTDIVTAGAILGLSRSVAYDLAARDAFPVPVIRAGSRYRVPVAALLAVLHIPLEPDPAART